MKTTNEVLLSLWKGAGLPDRYLHNANISLLGADEHVLPSSYRIGVAAQASIAASALAASLYRHLTTGSLIEVEIDARHAALEFASERYSRLRNTSSGNEVPLSHPEFKKMMALESDTVIEWDPLAGYYLCAQGRYIRLHTNWRHHKLGLLRIMGLSEDVTREQLAACLLKWDAYQLEESAREAGMCATMCRTAKEWKETQMSQSIQDWLDDNNECPVKVTKVRLQKDDTTSTKRENRGHLRVLDLSRVIAAPIAGRTLARYGADVLLISCLRLPNLPMLEIDTTRGKRSTEVDLDQKSGRSTMSELIGDADVLLQSYRPGALAKRGLSFDDLQQLRPGLVYAELNAYGFTGPWKDVRGFDSLVQSASGINSSEAESHHSFTTTSSSSLDKSIKHLSPRVLPCQVLDHAAGYLLAFGVMAAKCRSILEGEGNGWHVQVSLAGTAAWLESLGRIEGARAWQQPKPIDVSSQEVQSLLEEYNVRGSPEPLVLKSIRHSASPLPSNYKTVPFRLGVDAPRWLTSP